MLPHPAVAVELISGVVGGHGKRILVLDALDNSPGPGTTHTEDIPRGGLDTMHLGAWGQILTDQCKAHLVARRGPQGDQRSGLEPWRQESTPGMMGVIGTIGTTVLTGTIDHSLEY